MTKSEYRAIETYMLECMSDAAHDPEHVYRVLGIALELAKDFEGVDYDLLVAACLLHDVGRVEEFHDPSLSHAAVGADKAAKWLAEHGCDDAFCAKVRECIRAHSYRTGGKTEILEGQLLFDADKIEASGLIALTRTMAFSANLGRPMYVVGADGLVDESENTPPTSLRHYYEKLRKVSDRMYTARAREIVERHNRAMDAAVAALVGEVNEARIGLRSLDALLED